MIIRYPDDPELKNAELQLWVETTDDTPDYQAAISEDTAHGLVDELELGVNWLDDEWQEITIHLKYRHGDQVGSGD